MTRLTTRHGIRGLATASAITIALLLGGCAANTETYDEAVATRLQDRVMVSTESAAAGDHGASLTAIAELEVELRDALARGTVTQARFDSITSAIALVRADLEASIVATTPPPAPAEQSDDDDDDDDDDRENNGKGRKKD